MRFKWKNRGCRVLLFTWLFVPAAPAQTCWHKLVFKVSKEIENVVKRCQVPRTANLYELCDYPWMSNCIREDVVLMLSYIHRIGRINQSIANHFRQVVEREHPWKCLELGAGSGDLSNFLAESLTEPGLKFVATDLYPQANLFTRRHPYADFSRVKYARHPVAFSTFTDDIQVGAQDLVFSMGVSHHLSDSDWIDHLHRLDRAKVKTELAYDLHDRSIYNLIFATGVIFPTWMLPLSQEELSFTERLKISRDLPALSLVVMWDSPLSALRQRGFKEWQALLAKAGVPYSVSISEVGDRFHLLKVIEFKRESID